MGLEIAQWNWITQCFSPMNYITPRLYCSQIPTLLTLEQEREGISDNTVQEQTRNRSHNCSKLRHSLAVTWAPPAETASPPSQSIKSHQHKINSTAFDSYWRNSIDFKGVGVTPILCWCICISVREVTPAWLMETTAHQPTLSWLKFNVGNSKATRKHKSVHYQSRAFGIYFCKAEERLFCDPLDTKETETKKAKRTKYTVGITVFCN